MSDEQMTNLDAGDQEVIDNEILSDDDGLLGDAGEDPEELNEPPEEQDEIEVDGKKFALPKTAAEKLKAERLMHSDYTRKTQEVAEQRRAIEAQAQEVAQQRQDHQQYLQEVAQVVAIDRQLEQYQQLNWQSLIDDNPQQALKLQHEMRVLEQQRMQASNTLAQKQQQNALAEQQKTAKLVQEAEAFFAREIPNWSPQRSDELMAYAQKAGMQPTAVTKIAMHNPAFAVLLNKAALYDQIAQKPPAEPTKAPQAKPAAKVGQTANVRKDPSKMTDAEFAAYRRKVISATTRK